VLDQDYPAEKMEILVADGMSVDGARQIIQEYQHNHNNLRLIDNPGKIVPIGINAALKQANGEIVLRVDGHTLIAPDYVSQCVAALQRSGAENVGGRMDAVSDGAFGQAVALATSSPFGVGGARFHYSDKEEWVDTVYLGAWKRETFSRIGLFDEELVRDQDDEFNYRLREQGGKILLVPSIKSIYTVRGAPDKLWKQYFQYGFWKVRVLQKHPRQMRPRQFVPPLLALAVWLTVLWVWIYSVFSLWSPVSLMPLTFILIAYHLVALIASLYTAAKKGWRYLPLLPLVFGILHFAYGFGFLTGLVKFWNRWNDKVGKAPAWNPEASADAA
jgi:glycosyltransferase involved in cell wall biosynthesis